MYIFTVNKNYDSLHFNLSLESIPWKVNPLLCGVAALDDEYVSSRQHDINRMSCLKKGRYALLYQNMLVI